MAPGIILPTTLPDGTLYRVTYEGPSTEEWAYRYDLVEHTTGYTCSVHLSAPSRAALRRCRQEHLELLLQATTVAMQELLDEHATWQPARATHASAIARRMTITRTPREPFGELASRIITNLPRLREATITAHYQ